MCTTQEKTLSEIEGFWGKLLWLLSPPAVPSCPAVCVTPGSRLVVHGITTSLQREAGIESSVEEVVFTQTSVERTFRDSIRFSNGVLISLQKLKVGQTVEVLSVEAPVETEATRSGVLN